MNRKQKRRPDSYEIGPSCFTGEDDQKNSDSTTLPLIDISHLSAALPFAP
jgi:hypothetical protein